MTLLKKFKWKKTHI